MAPSSSLPQVYPSHVVVAVWEWQDGLGIWHPYSATVCSFIEQHFVRQRGQHFGLGSLAHSIPLGQADPSLAPYIIDLPSWTQFRQNTGKTLLPLEGEPLVCDLVLRCPLSCEPLYPTVPGFGLGS